MDELLQKQSELEWGLKYKPSRFISTKYAVKRKQVDDLLVKCGSDLATLIKMFKTFSDRVCDVPVWQP